MNGRGRDARRGSTRPRRAGPAGTGQRPLGAAPDRSEPPLGELVEQFWALGEELAGLRFRIEGPRVPEAVLKRLGSPAPARQGERPASAELARLYARISERAIHSAFEDGE